MPIVRLCETKFYRLNMKTRFPFRFGIASMTEVPHLLVSVRVETDAGIVAGCSSDGLPPKWFTKNPETTFDEDDLPAMLRSVRSAAAFGQELGEQPTFFDWWCALYEAQSAWARQNEVGGLLAGLGTSLLERAVLDAICRANEMRLTDALRKNYLGIEFARLRPSLKSLEPRDVLPEVPSKQIHVRHTVGLGDRLNREPDLFHDDPQDGLPFTLEENIEAYGLRYFKIKLSGDVANDRSRLLDIAGVVGRTVGPEARFTLDGNENFQTMNQFRDAWNEFRESPVLREFFDQSLLFVEQPVHRDHALAPSVHDELRSWQEAPPTIIDESDADLTSLPRALELGYRGTSHKNCKGILKGLLAAATLALPAGDRRPRILSAEDLGNVGPYALLQDLAMVAALGIPHVERNGHHYFAGLSMFPQGVQNSLLLHHSDLYQRHRRGFAALALSRGQLSLKSVTEAPFGLLPRLDLSQFDRWEF